MLVCPGTKLGSEVNSRQKNGTRIYYLEIVKNPEFQEYMEKWHL